ncbi:MAG TPA: hypothetical protein VK524_21105, partial [Polyangiaceae bacterium]|nr:hypothetical protein [Polyangiaceae bacterium]
MCARSLYLVAVAAALAACSPTPNRSSSRFAPASPIRESQSAPSATAAAASSTAPAAPSPETPAAPHSPAPDLAAGPPDMLPVAGGEFTMGADGIGERDE